MLPLIYFVVFCFINSNNFWEAPESYYHSYQNLTKIINEKTSKCGFENDMNGQCWQRLTNRLVNENNLKRDSDDS